MAGSGDEETINVSEGKRRSGETSQAGREASDSEQRTGSRDEGPGARAGRAERAGRGLRGSESHRVRETKAQKVIEKSRSRMVKKMTKKKGKGPKATASSSTMDGGEDTVNEDAALNPSEGPANTNAPMTALESSTVQPVQRQARRSAVTQSKRAPATASARNPQPSSPAVAVSERILRVATPPLPRSKKATNMKRLTEVEVEGRQTGEGTSKDRDGDEEDMRLVATDDDDDDEVMLVDSDEEEVQGRKRFQNENPLLAPDVDLKNYRRHVLDIDVSLISQPKQNIRLVYKDHVDEMYRLIKEHGYMISSGTLSVTLKESSGIGLDEVQKMIENGRVSAAVWLIDGVHRLIVLRKAAIKDVKVTLWVPARDKLCLTFAEIVNIGAYLNKTTSMNKDMSFQDQIHACVSLARVLDTKESVDIRSCTPSHLAIALYAGKTLGRQKLRQLQRYGMIGLRLAQDEEMFKAFLEETESPLKLNLSHLASELLLGLEVKAFRLGLQCVKQRLQVSVQSGVKASGRFDRLSKEFYTNVSQMYEEVKKAAQFSNKTVEDILGAYVGRTKVSIVDSIRTAMGRFREVANMKLASQKRIESLKTRLKKLPGVGDYEVTVESPSEYSDIIFGDEHEAEIIESERDGDAGDGVDITNKNPEPIQPKPQTEASTQGPNSRNPSHGKVKIPVITRVQETTTEVEKDNGVPVRKSARNKKRKNYDEVPEDEEFNLPSESGRKKKKPKLKKKGGPSGIEKNSDGGVRQEDLVHALESLPDVEISRIMDAIGMDVVPQPEKPSENEEDDRLLDSKGGGFNDDVPRDLPKGYSDPTPYIGPDNPEWCRFAYRFPSQWPEQNPIEHVLPFLEAIFVPHEHRGNVFFNKAADLLRTNHHLVFWRAALNYFADHPDDAISIEGDARFADVPERLLPWARAIAGDYASLAYFAEQRGELESQGYCVLKGFLDDERNPLRVGTMPFPQIDGDMHAFSQLRAEVKSTFPGSSALRDAANRTVWNWIVNEGFDIDAIEGEKGIARYTTTNFGVTSHLEQILGELPTARYRALLDLRIAQAMSALVVWKNSGRREKTFVPKTGGRWLMTAQGCKRQALHTDFPSMSRSDTLRNTKNPGYFTIATGNMEVPVWVCPFSHKTVAMAPERGVRAMAMGSVAAIVRIPPHSIFVGRGDMFHAGAAYADSAGDGSCLRYHLYFAPTNHRLEDGVHLLQKFNPVMKTNFDDDTDDDIEEIADEEGNQLVDEDGEADATRYVNREVNLSQTVPATQLHHVEEEPTAKALDNRSAGLVPDSEEEDEAPSNPRTPVVQFDIDDYEEESG